MDTDDQITHGVIRGISMSHGLIPLLPMAPRGTKAIKRRDRERKH